MKKPGLFFAVIFFFFLQIQLDAQHTDAYHNSIHEWQRQRVAALLAPDGWVNLAGLFWLGSGKNSFGSDSTNTLVFTHPQMPGNAGYFDKDNGVISWVSHTGVTVLAHDSLFQSGIIYAEGKTDRLLSLGNFRWNIIKREDKFGVRFRNLASPALAAFKAIAYFPTDAKWRINAHLETGNASSLLITNVLGQTTAVPSPGKLVFTIHQQVCSLDVIPAGDKLFIVFGDATSGKETYAAGRFIDVDMPDAKGNTIIDFNKAYNPPCAFTRFATCPLPPKQNILPLAVTAGEKDYHGYDH